MSNPHLISCEELSKIIDQPNLRIFDASWYLPSQARDALAEYKQGHIKGAQFFDIDGLSDKNSSLPHMLMEPQEFAKTMGKMGISDNNDIVVYDGMGLFSCARAWWNLRIMGAKSVRILDGGLPLWNALQLPLETEIPKLTATTFKVNFNEHAVIDAKSVLKAISQNSHEILDARPLKRFTGEVKEPREGLKSGHMAGAKSLPFDSLLEDGRLKSAEAIEEILQTLSFDDKKPTITTCGSGVSAAIITLAFETIGKTHIQLYDGSWSEWGGEWSTLNDAPIIQGEK